MLFGGAGARAEVELEFFHFNDIGTATPHKDDLYTATFGLKVTTPNYRYLFQENMFTDRRNDTRFDETYLAAGRRLPRARGWEMWAAAGVVHVGEGLFGQSVQNWAHRLVGNPEVFLTYIDDERYHATLEFEAFRPSEVREKLKVGPWVDLHAAFDFKQRAIAGATLEWGISKRFLLDARVAARYSHTDLDELQPWIVEFGPAAELGLSFNRFLFASYSYNAFGTEDHHWLFRVRWVID